MFVQSIFPWFSLIKSKKWKQARTLSDAFSPKQTADVWWATLNEVIANPDLAIRIYTGLLTLPHVSEEMLRALATRKLVAQSTLRNAKPLFTALLSHPAASERTAIALLGVNEGRAVLDACGAADRWAGLCRTRAVAEIPHEEPAKRSARILATLSPQMQAHAAQVASGQAGPPKGFNELLMATLDADAVLRKRDLARRKLEGDSFALLLESEFESAPNAQRDVARSLLPQWQGTPQALVDTVTGITHTF